MSLDSLQAFSDEFAAMVDKVAHSTVRVDARNRIAGSGIIWNSDGVILTADHVVEREENIAVQVDGASHEAELVGRDPTTDLALLRIKATGLPAAQIAEPQTLRAGSLVFAVGRPWGEEPIVSAGIVSAIGRFGFGGGWGEQFREGLINADLVLYPGFSGGPLADASGRVVGLNTSALGRGGLSFAVPMETAARIAAQLLKEGRVKRGYLGVGVQKIPLAESLAKKFGLKQPTALMILTVEGGGSGEQAGLLPGDMLVGLNGTPIARVRELHRWLSSETGGREVKARVIRGGELKELPITVGVR